MCNIKEKISKFIKTIKGRGHWECAECNKRNNCNKDLWIHSFDIDCNYKKIHDENV